MENRAPIGDMRDRVRIEHPVEVNDGIGQVRVVWELVDEVNAIVVPLAGDEILAAKTVQVTTTDRVQMRYREDVERFGPKWRLVVSNGWNRILNIESARRLGRDRLELMCRGESRVA